MHIKGFGKIGINRRGIIEEIPFTNTIDTDFVNKVKTKFKTGDKASCINSSDFEIDLNGGDSNASDGGRTLKVRPVNDPVPPNHTEGGGTLAPSIVGNTLIYRWNADDIPVYLPGATDNQIITINSVKLRAKWGTDTSYTTIGEKTNMSGSQYDYNDYVQYVSYNIKIDTPDDCLSGDIARNSVFYGNVDIKPTVLVIYDEDSNDISQNDIDPDWNSSITINNLQLQHEPKTYKLFIGNPDDNVLFDSGDIGLVNPSIEEHAWLSGDTINFYYITDVFN